MDFRIGFGAVVVILTNDSSYGPWVLGLKYLLQQSCDQRELENTSQGSRKERPADT
jgi:hypothetical protein